ncbi:Fur family transcriptional regulator [Caproiciproducens faecalis]|uniref:Transcriptional repressor n=1 Tax=Caproiciproducens faecalis TaxID=2820301 RepID=A0ABS7DKN2_9FIRM|nr:transcriptional repressor [Caproiciproducens faecalis]MBW7571793.1 transcriptional repressor [Caproiciproducens faecalis]
MEKKQNFSRKREAILNAVKNTSIHPTAEWVYQTLKPVYPDLSLGTVYRNLAQFKNDGVIVSVGTVNGQERFDGNTQPHTHFICSSCGAVIDIPGEPVSLKSTDEIVRKYHIVVDSIDVQLHGLCEECLQRQTPLK